MTCTHPDNKNFSLALHIGPLRYLFEARDDWGKAVLEEINKHVACARPSRRYDRIIHMVELADREQVQIVLPGRLTERLPISERNALWTCTSNPVNTFWSSQGSRHVFWGRAASTRIGTPRFHLPWNLVITDCITRGGGLAHGGLAMNHTENGLLFLAPPGGGKTTTLKTVPPDWTVLSDDAALVWPGTAGTWFASPLPAWGNLITPQEEWRFPAMRLDRCCQLKSVLVLQKSRSISLEQLSPAESVPALHRALGEYPVTIMAEAIRSEERFRIAARIARDLLCWKLALPLNGNIWPLLDKEAA